MTLIQFVFLRGDSALCRWGATPEFGGSEKRGKRDRQSITKSTPGFQKLSTAM